MPLEQLVAAPALEAPTTGLLQVCPVVEHPVDSDSHWLAAVRFQPESPAGVEVVDPCGNPVLSGAATHRPPRVGLAFELVVEDTCSSWGWTVADYEGRALRGLAAKEGTGLEREWERGVLIPANPHLADAADPNLVTLNAGAGTSPRDSLALLDESIANSAAIIGRGLIHATPYVCALWASLYPQLDTDEKTGAMLSPGGNPIVNGHGYMGASPAGVVDGTHAVQWAYATDMMVIHRSTEPTILPETLAEAMDRKANTVTYRATRPYAIAWAGLHHAAVSVAVAPAASGAAGSALVDVSDRSGRLLGALTPPGTAVTASATGAASAIAATLPGVAARTTYITGFEVTAAGATAGTVVTVTVTGTTGGTLSYVFAVPAGVTVGAAPLAVEFASPIPASAANTAVAVNVPSLGAGNTAVAVVAHGFQL